LMRGLKQNNRGGTATTPAISKRQNIGAGRAGESGLTVTSRLG
jgi:hypothetical protein